MFSNVYAKISLLLSLLLAVPLASEATLETQQVKSHAYLYDTHRVRYELYKQASLITGCFFLEDPERIRGIYTV